MASNYETSRQTKRGWTKIPNAIRHDKKLTSDAKVVIEELLSVSGDYTISIKGIAKTINLSESKVKRAVELLQGTGYLQIVKIRNGKYFAGYKWMISDIPGVYRKCTDGISMDGISMDGISIPATSNHGISNDGISIHEKSMDALLYQETNKQHTNNQQKNNEMTEWNEERENEAVYLSPYPLPSTKVPSFKESSFEANASPLANKTSSQSEQVISYINLNVQEAFDRFCDVYPNLGDIDRARAAFLTIPDISNICHQIANSVEWFKNNRKWDDWQTGRKNVSCPQAEKFLKRGDWKQYLKSGAYTSEEERLMNALNRSKQNNNSILGGIAYETI